MIRKIYNIIMMSDNKNRKGPKRVLHNYSG